MDNTEIEKHKAEAEVERLQRRINSGLFISTNLTTLLVKMNQVKFKLMQLEEIANYNFGESIL